MEEWMREAKQGSFLLGSRLQVKTQILCNAELRQDFAKCVVLVKDYIMQTKVNKPQELHIYSDRIPSTTPGAEPPRDAKDSGSARSHSTRLETSSSNRP